MGKIEKLNRDIQKLEDKIRLIEDDLDSAKQDQSDKLITKAEYTTIKQKHQLKVRDIRTAIGRKEKARMLHEKKIREKEQKKAEKKAKKEK
jgi:hypothetical protein